MPPKPKFRLFGGPNGSGKTHVFKKFKERGIIHTEVYVNADRIEAELKEKVKDKSFIDYFVIKAGVLRIGKQVSINSYHGSFVASYLAERLFETKQSFAFETVMSHESKVDLLKLAHQGGYKTYFYFIFADSISTNIARVQLRVLGGGHGVAEETIKNRAPRTFGLLPAAFEAADSAYVIDNSNEAVPILTKEGYAIVRAANFPSIINKPIQDILKGLSKAYAVRIMN
jgi:predicted ABC-type ATPase